MLIGKKTNGIQFQCICQRRKPTRTLFLNFSTIRTQSSNGTGTMKIVILPCIHKYVIQKENLTGILIKSLSLILQHNFKLTKVYLSKKKAMERN